MQYIPNPFNIVHLFPEPHKSYDYLLLMTEKRREARKIDLLTSRPDDVYHLICFLYMYFLSAAWDDPLI